MKKIISLFFLLYSTLPFAQVDKNSIALGIKSGINFSNITVTQSTGLSPIIETKVNPGFLGGIVFKQTGEGDPLMSFQLELNLSQRGWKETSDSISNFYSRKLWYLEIPALASMTVLKNQKINGFINFGLNTSYKISDKEKNNDNAPITRDYYNETTNRSIDFGVVIGGGLNYSFEKSRLQLELRFYRGLSDLYKPNENFSLFQHQILGLNAVYFFWVKKR